MITHNGGYTKHECNCDDEHWTAGDVVGGIIIGVILTLIFVVLVLASPWL